MNNKDLFDLILLILISCVFWIFFQKAGSQFCFFFFFFFYLINTLMDGMFGTGLKCLSTSIQNNFNVRNDRYWSRIMYQISQYWFGNIYQIKVLAVAHRLAKNDSLIRMPA